jgi:hypothetical protein
MSETSDRLISSIREQRMDEIFRLLDSDCDGEISTYKVDLSQLNNDIIEVLENLFVEIEEKALVLNLKTFKKLA